MQNDITQAKLFAKAIFSIALQQQQLNRWRKILNRFSQMAKEYEKKRILSNPTISFTTKVALFKGIINSTWGDNLLWFLAQQKKLKLLPKIAFEYQKLFLTYRQILLVKVVSAYELSTIQKGAILNALKRKHTEKLLLQYSIDVKLIGGAVIYLGDKEIIDGSISGILQRLKKELITKCEYAQVR